MGKNSLFNRIWRSLGIKRRLASYFSAILEPLRLIPGADAIIAGLELTAGGLGAAGVAHAGVAGEFKGKKVISAGALLALVISLSHYIPELAPLIPLLQKLAALTGGAALGMSLAKNEQA